MKNFISKLLSLFGHDRLQDYVPDEVIERNKEAQYLRALQMNIKLKHQNDKLRDTISRFNAREFASFRNLKTYHEHVMKLCKILKKGRVTPPKEILDFDREIVSKVLTPKTKKK